MGRDMLMEKLLKRGIDTRPFFTSMSLQPAFHRVGLFEKDRMPVSEWLGRNGLYLPSSSKLTKSQMDYVIRTIKELVV
jgi:perosamine synthetase